MEAPPQAANTAPPPSQPAPAANSAPPAPPPVSSFRRAQGRFAIGGGRSLCWQSARPQSPPPQNAAFAPPRGTVLLLQDWGIPFRAQDALLSALTARGFCVAGYDWYHQGSLPAKTAKTAKTAKQKNAKKAKPQRQHYACRFNAAALSHFLHSVALPDFPAPFYVLGQGLGALFALSSQNILRSAASRMALVSPPMSWEGHAPRSFYHWRVKAAAHLASKSKKRLTAARSSLAYKANVLNHAAEILSPAFYKTMRLPCLILSASGDSQANIAGARLAAEHMRFADALLIPAAAPEQMLQSAAPLFWAAFDAFIPGSDEMRGNARLEHPFLL